jgi:hypothetical protein
MPSAVELALQKDVRELRFQIENTTRGIDQANLDIAMIGRNLGNVITTVGNTPAAPTANLIWNGELGHSVNSWFDSAYTTDDKAKEAAHWFSHDGTLDGLTLDSTDARTSSANKALKELTHSTYDNDFGRWDSANGWAEIQGIKTVDALLPANLIDATTPLARVSMVAARRSRFIEIPPDSLMFAGIYDNTAGQLKFLTGSLGFTASRIGAAGATERRFKIHVLSDRGYSIVSPEVIISDAPADGDFSATRNISMSWKFTAGQLRVDIYEYVPSAGVYKLIEEVSSGNSFIYQGNSLRTVTGYPVSATSERTAVYYTRTGEATNLAINGLTPAWDTVNFPIQIPDNYNKANTTGRQWLRIGFTVAANLLVDECTADGSATVTAPAAAFDLAYAADYAGLVAKIYSTDGTLLQTTSVVSRTDDTHILLAATVTAGTGLFLRLIAGGFHGVYIDKVHLGYQQNTSYAPNAFDIRTLQPLAAPTSSTQGGSGGGNTGGIYCVGGNTPIKQANDDWQPAQYCNTGEYWASAEFRPNLLIKLIHGREFTRQVLAENGVYAEVTDTERFICDRNDAEGTPLYRLREGDSVLTEIDGSVESSRIVYISPLSGEKQNVYTPVLSGNRLFIGGEIRLKRYQKIWRAIWKKRGRRGGFLFHNLKQPLEPDYPLP